MDQETRELREDDMDYEAYLNDYEPAPGSTADVDFVMWQKYTRECRHQGVHPSVSDYVVWLEEQSD